MVQRGQWPALDGLRGISIIFVVSVHMWASGARVPILLRVADYDIDFTWFFATGHNAVQTFFVLSGFLLYRHWLEEDGLGAGEKIAKFFRHRVRRIVPAYLAAFLVYIALVFLVGRYHASVPPTLPNIAINMLFLSPWAYLAAGQQGDYIDLVPGTWSLNPEFYFYISMPVLAVLFRKVPARAVLFFLIASIGPLYRHYLPANAPLGLLLCFPGVLDGFFLGMAAASLVRGRLEHVRRANALLFPLGALWYLSVCMHGVLFKSILFDYRFQLSCSSALMVIGLVAAGDFCWKRWLSGSLLVELGKISYSVFLFNVFVIWYAVFPIRYLFGIGSDPASFFMNIILGWPLIIALALLSYRMVELPFLRSRPAEAGRRLGSLAKFVLSSIALLALPAAVQAFRHDGNIGEFRGVLSRLATRPVDFSQEFGPLIDRDRPLAYDVSTGVSGEMPWGRGGKVSFEGIPAGTGEKWIALYLPLKAELLPRLGGRLVRVSADVDLRGSGYRACLEIYTGDHEVCPEALSAGQSEHLVVEAVLDHPERAQVKISFFPEARAADIAGSLSNIVVTY